MEDEPLWLAGGGDLQEINVECAESGGAPGHAVSGGQLPLACDSRREQNVIEEVSESSGNFLVWATLPEQNMLPVICIALVEHELVVVAAGDTEPGLNCQEVGIRMELTSRDLQICAVDIVCRLIDAAVGISHWLNGLISSQPLRQPVLQGRG